MSSSIFPTTTELITECRSNSSDLLFFMNKTGLLTAIPPGFLSVPKVRELRELQYIPLSSAVEENIQRGPQGLVSRNFSMNKDIDHAMLDTGLTNEYRIQISPRGNSRLDRKDILIYGFGVLETTEDVKPTSLSIDVEHDYGQDFNQAITNRHGESHYYSWDNNNIDYFHELEPMIHLKRHVRIASFRFSIPKFVENMYIKLYGITVESLGVRVTG